MAPAQDLVAVSLDLSSVQKGEWRQVQDAEGRFTRLEYIHPTSPRVGVANGMSLVARLEDWPDESESTPRRKAELRDDVRARMGPMHDNDVVAVIFVAKSKIMEAANRLIARADIVNHERQDELAGRRRARA